MDIFYLRKKVSNIIRIILISLIFLIFIIRLFQNSTPVYAKDSDENDESLTQSKNFQKFGTEVSYIKGEIADSNSVLPERLAP